MKVYQSACDHTHNGHCARCELLAATIQEIEESLDKIPGTQDEVDDLIFTIEQAKRRILAWKSHLLRSMNQEDARLDLMGKLDDKSVFLVQDWAMKYLPRKYRESQRDWYGKRGIPWHITVAFRRGQNNELEMTTIVHIFQSCSQESDVVLVIMNDVIRQLKSVMPNLETVNFRSDNAGCYHSAFTIANAKSVGIEYGVKVQRMDFSDPQGGKGACDRKAATIKSHMRLFLNSGNDIETSVQMKRAIESSGGVPNVSVTLASSPDTSALKACKWAGVSFFNNIEYGETQLRVWKAYNIGTGRLIPWEKFAKVCDADLPPLPIIESNAAQNIKFATPRSGKKASDTPTDDTEEESDSEVPINPSSDKLFCCPEEDCVKSFQRYSNLQYHLECGKHKKVLEHETLLDKAMIDYANKLEQGSTRLQDVAFNPSITIYRLYQRDGL